MTYLSPVAQTVSIPPVALRQRFSGLLSAGNGSNKLTSVTVSALHQTRSSGQAGVKTREEQFNEELIANVNLLSSKPNEHTARSMSKGFKTLDGAIRQLLQELLLSQQRLTESIADLYKNTQPVMREDLLELKHSLLYVKEAIGTLESLIKRQQERAAHRHIDRSFTHKPIGRGLTLAMRFLSSR